MSVGKWSPTVVASYRADQGWWERHCANPNDYFDLEGYDMYGYHQSDGRDRAGYTEDDYLQAGEWLDDEYYNHLLDRVLSDWGKKIISS